MVNAIGAFLRNLRFKTGETLKDMAEKLDYAPTYLSGIENGKRDAPRSLYDKVVSIYDLSFSKAEEFKSILYGVWMERDYNLSSEKAEKVIDILFQESKTERRMDSVKKTVQEKLANKELSAEQCEKILSILEETDKNIKQERSVYMGKIVENTKPLEHIRIEYNPIKDVVVWFKQDCKINKKTLVSIPDGFKMQAMVSDGHRTVGRGRPIAGPCIKENLAEKLSLSKSELNENDSYSFYFYVTSAQLLTFPWGTGAQGYDYEFEVAYKWGAHGTYTISIVDPMRLVEAVNRVNPVKKSDIDPVNPKDNKLFSHVEEKAKNAVASFLVDKKTTVLNVNARLQEISEAVTKAMSQDSAITSHMGVKFVFTTVGNVGLSEADAERVKKAIEDKKAKLTN